MGAENRATAAIRRVENKTPSLFLWRFQAGNLQAGRQAQDLPKWEPSIVMHLSQPHVPYPWARAQQDRGLVVVVLGAGAVSLSTNLYVWVFVCVHMYVWGREGERREGCQCVPTSFGTGAAQARPYWRPQATRQPPWVWSWVCVRVQGVVARIADGVWAGGAPLLVALVS